MAERVLLVDDEDDVAASLRGSLTRAGYEVDVARDVVEAMSRFDAGGIDVVVTDLRMPGQSGFDLLGHIDDVDPGLPVIIITGDPSVQAAARAVRGDAFDYLTKPVSHGELVDAVARAATRRRDVRDAHAAQRRREDEHRRLAARHQFIAQLLGVLYDRAEEGIVVFDEAGVVLDASRSFADLVGRRGDEVSGTHGAELFEPHPTEGDIGDRIQILASSLTRETQWRGEVSVRVAGGRSVPARLSLSACVAPSEGGSLERYVVGLLFHQAGHEELSEHLQRADRLATVGLLAGSAVHEIKNELGPLLGFVSLLESGEASFDPPMIAAIRDSVRRVREHTEQILEPLRPRLRARGAVVLQPCIASIIEVLTRAGRMRRIQVDVESPDGDVVVMADKDEVHQIALNLVTNAIEALGDGDGGARGRIMVTMRRDDDAGVLEVADDGIGVDPATRSRVFEPFFTTKGPAGTGLGLPVVHDIVRSLRGSVSLEPRRGGGTIVTVALPLFRG